MAEGLEERLIPERRAQLDRRQEKPEEQVAQLGKALEGALTEIRQVVLHLRPVVRTDPHLQKAASPMQGDERAIGSYQLEQAVKQLIVVEGHLTDARTAGSPLCCYCISKHAFALQALGRWAGEVRGEGDQCELGDADLTRLAERARAFRKALMAALDREGEAPPARAAGHLATAAPVAARLGGNA